MNKCNVIQLIGTRLERICTSLFITSLSVSVSDSSLRMQPQKSCVVISDLHFLTSSTISGILNMESTVNSKWILCATQWITDSTPRSLLHFITFAAPSWVLKKVASPIPKSSNSFFMWFARAWPVCVSMTFTKSWHASPKMLGEWRQLVFPEMVDCDSGRSSHQTSIRNKP